MAQSIQQVRHASSKVSSKPKFRADIQGLRALAVIAVILDHLLHWPAGGFIGVDVFFVISGFMITTIMIREHRQTGAISFKEFYKRRVKRLLPASVLTIVVTAAAAWLIFAKARAVETLWDAASALLFSSNWRFASAGTDYFQQDIPPSPLQHFWSLGVEEQFYFVWPFLLVAVFALAGKAGHRRGLAYAAVAMVVLIAASLLWSLFESATNPTWAYFSTASRTWELGVGALLAVCAGALRSLPDTLRPALAWLGLLGIIASMFIIKPTDAFPAPWAILPVVATALVIAANIGGEQRGLGVLTNRASVYIGNISFSLYLWHFPVIIFAGALMEPDLAYYGVVVAGIILLAVASYHGIENPLRKMPWWFEDKKSRPRSPLGIRPKLVALGMLAMLSLGTAGFALLKSAPVDVPRQPIAAPTIGSTEAPVSPLTLSIQTALSSPQWPELTPAIGEVGTGSKAPELGVPGCLNPRDLSNAEQCTFNPGGGRSAFVVGDSIGISWMPAVRGALEPEGYSVHGIGLSNCPFADVQISIENDPETSARCNDGHAQVYAQIKASAPELLIISDAVAGIVNLASDAKGLAAHDEWIAGLTRAVEAASVAGTRVVILSPNPTGKSVTECYNNFSKPSDCESSISDAWKQKSAADTEAAKAVGATYVDTSQWFCSGERCPIFADGAPIRWDSMHLTEAYAKKLVPQLSPALLPTAS